MRTSAMQVQGEWLIWLIIIGIAIAAVLTHRSASQQQRPMSEEDYTKQRKVLVEHLKQQGIEDKRVLEAMLKVPRHEFVPEKYRHLSYENVALPIGEGQTISQPYIVAFMTQALQLKPTDRVLEIGTGSGYQAAILAELVKEVYTIEIIPSLAKRAMKTLNKLGYKNIKVRIGDGYRGWKKYAPFDAIIVTCAPDHIPQPLIEQLKDGGRMVIPVDERYVSKRHMQLYVLRKEAGKMIKRAVLDVLFVPMLGEAMQQKEEKK